MIFEIASTLLMAGVTGMAYLKSNGPATNDADKIQKIFSHSGWNGKAGETIRIHRKTKFKGGVEYVYQLPLGFDRKKIESEKHILEDGLNIRHKTLLFSPKDLLSIKLNKDILKQVKKVLAAKQIQRKEIEIQFDGMLKIRVYDAGLPESVPWEESFISKGWNVPIGRTRSDFIYHDFDSSYFMIVAGAAGFGKSQFIKMVITTLAKQKPDHVHFHLIDLKGGLAFSRFRNLKQVEQFEKDAEGAYEALKRVQNLMNMLHEYLEREGFEDAKEAGIKDRHFIVIDEAADLTPDCQDIVEDIARRGRACGLRMLYATQYPTNETLRSQVRQNALARVCFKLKTNIASRAVLDEGGAEELPEIPGRAIYQTVSNTIVQTPFISNKEIKKQIEPFVVIKARKEEEALEDQAAAERGRNPFEFEEV